MTICSSVETQIREAIDRSDFDNLSNKGKPLDLWEWEKTPPHLRLSHTILKNAGYSPSEVWTKKEIAELWVTIENEPESKPKKRLIQRLNALEITDAIQLEKLLKK